MGTVTLATRHSMSKVPPVDPNFSRAPGRWPSTENSISGPYVAKVCPERMASFRLPFPEADRKLLAIECHEFAECCLQGRTPEVDGAVGRKAMALCYAAFESSALNRPVTLEEVEREQVSSYEAEINAHYRI